MTEETQTEQPFTMMPLGKDLAVERVSDQQALKTDIFVRDDDQTDIQRYRVIKVGPDVSLVSEGDIIIMSWANITPPFTQNGKKVGITNESEIMAVIDEEDG